jgi:RHS repeat-associated protein
MLTDTLYTATGQTARTSNPYYDSTNTAPGTDLAGVQGAALPGATQHVYDGAGRETATIFLANGSEKWRATTAYGGDRTSVTPPHGGIATTTVTDAHGRTVELRQYHNPADVGGDDPARFDAARYGYTLLGQAAVRTDAVGNTWTSSYDLRGRTTRAADPDKGTTTSTYTPTGLLATVTAPVGTGTATTAYTYDPLGRRTSTRDDSATGPVRASWVYDTLPNGNGKLTSSTRYDRGGAYTNRVDAYDSTGRPTATSVVLPTTETGLCAAATPDPCTYTTTTTYKQGGPVNQVTLPAAADLPAEKLTYGYTDVGLEGSLLSAAQIYAGSVTYNKVGQLTQRVFGATGSRVAETITYDDPTTRLTDSNVVPESRPEAADYSYRYDDSGDITQINGSSAGQSTDQQCFRYDYLRRLTDAWTPSGDCAMAPTVTGLAGPAPYWQSWTFDQTGNRLTEVRRTGSGDTTDTYTYPQAGSAHPHAVAAVTTSGASTATRNYTYDDAGNTRTRPGSTGATQTLTYDREGRLDTLTEGNTGTHYLADADGNRFIRTDPTGRTLYLPGGTEVRYDTATGTRRATRYCTHYGEAIAVRTATSLTWLVNDHHGTAQVAIDAATLTPVTRRTLPYGDVRGTSTGTWPAGMDKGFLGGTQDPAGLTHLGAREYDPAMGRFVSVDPIFNQADPQQWNGYAYANNSPVTSADPSGLEHDEEACAEVCQANGGRVPDSMKPPSQRSGASGCQDHCGGPNSPAGPTGRVDCRDDHSIACVKTPDELKLEDQVNQMLDEHGDHVPECGLSSVVLGYVTDCLTAQVAVDIYLSHSDKVMSPYERAWCNMVGPGRCYRAQQDKDLADSFAKQFYNNDSLDPHWNAVHHGVWMALLAMDGFSEKEMMLLGGAHELGALRTGNAPPHGSVDSRIDMNNNQTGFRIGKEVASSYQSDEMIPMNAVRAAIEDAVVRAAAPNCVQQCLDQTPRPGTRTLR